MVIYPSKKPTIFIIGLIQVTSGLNPTLLYRPSVVPSTLLVVDSGVEPVKGLILGHWRWCGYLQSVGWQYLGPVCLYPIKALRAQLNGSSSPLDSLFHFGFSSCTKQHRIHHFFIHELTYTTDYSDYTLGSHFFLSFKINCFFSFAFVCKSPVFVMAVRSGGSSI